MRSIIFEGVFQRVTGEIVILRDFNERGSIFAVNSNGGM